MGNIKVSESSLKGVYEIIPELFEDERGNFTEIYQEEAYKAAGIPCRFVQDNVAFSMGGVLRGLHFQKKFPQDKLIWVLDGEIYDVAVDIRKNSENFGKWYGCILSAQNRKQLFIPGGFAHGYMVLSPSARVFYKCSERFHPEDEDGIFWNDPEIGIQWPDCTAAERILSEKDQRWQRFAEYRRSL